MSEHIGDRIKDALDAYADQLVPAQEPIWLCPQPRTSWAHRWAAPLAAAVVAAMLIGGVAAVRAHSTSRIPAAPATIDVRDKLAAIARASADGNDDQGPVTASAVLTTRSRAAGYLEFGTVSTDNAPVWVVQIHGDFVCVACKLAPGGKLPVGRLMTLVLDVGTLIGSDFSISEKEPDLSTLGSPVALPVPEVSTDVLVKLSAAARTQAEMAGAKGPITASAVLANSQQADGESRSAIEGASKQWFVQVIGKFVCIANCFSSSPRPLDGTVITFTLDPSYQAVRFELSNEQSDLSKLGVPITLSP